MAEALPIEAALPELTEALRTTGQAVLQAPPGAGKTTRVPLALLESGLYDGTILMLEPRRLAARSSAARMAQMLGEPLGGTVGYRIRGEAKTSKQTRIEVVTEGILTRRLQSDPELSGVSLVIFDEFHERSLQADLGLALCLEVRAALRDDLGLLVMSATLDAAPVAALMGDAPMVTSQGRSFPVDLRYLDRPRGKTERLEHGVAEAVRQAATAHSGNILVFLPGEGEIRRTQSALHDLPDGIAVLPLYGALPFKAQQAAIAPPVSGRKVVLATSIAETSLTIEGIDCVIDAGLSRRARFDPGSGMSRLVTERVTRAEATQRAGRAGRLSAGTCYRLWTKGEDGALAAFPPAEIEAADLTGLALEMAQWGSSDLPFLTPPPVGALTEAQSLLRDLEALDDKGHLTAHGRAMARLPLHPRLAHMLLRAGKGAAPLAALLDGRTRLRAAQADAAPLVAQITGARPAPPEARAAVQALRQEAKRLAQLAPEDQALSLAQAAALAYPDRVGLRRNGDAPRWLLSGGKGIEGEPEDALASARLIVALDTDGRPRDARLRRALAISEGELREIYPDRIDWHDVTEWSPRERRVLARRHERFGALVLKDQIWKDAPAEAIARAALDGVRDLGLPWSPAARRLQARALLLAKGGGDIADLEDTALMDSAETWLLPYLDRARNADAIRALDLVAPLQAHIGWAAMTELDRIVPAHFTTPMARKVPIDYAGEHPEIHVRLQEMFGVTTHPTVGPDRSPLRVTLLSPAQKPLQTTMDLPGFWTGSYADVRKDMRARYPRHPWPEDPREADPTLRAKPRGT